MRFLDLDLDFFLNKNAYQSGFNGERLGAEYQPWSTTRVRNFLENRCGLSPEIPVQGRTVTSHDDVLAFWQSLIKSGKLKIPFEVIHIDAHPDLWVGQGMYLTPEYLHVDRKSGRAMLKLKHIHPGNYLTFAIVYGWVGSLVWVPLLKYWTRLPPWDADARSIMIQLKKSKGEASAAPQISDTLKERNIHFEILPWEKFRTRAMFDYIALSKSPDFTPPESDRLITLVEGYMKQI
jgi:hypothetical protein